MSTSPLKPWPADAVIIVAARKGTEVRRQMSGAFSAVCRDCGTIVRYDPRTRDAAETLPERRGRAVAFLCVECHATYDSQTITHMVDHRPLPSALPTNLQELIAYLQVRPWVDATSDVAALQGRRRFLKAAGGALWFRNPLTRSDTFLPVNCGLVDSETGIEFDDGGFTVLKFGKTIRFNYVAD